MLLFWNVKGNSCDQQFHQIYSQEPVNLKEKKTSNIFYENRYIVLYHLHKTSQDSRAQTSNRIES